VVGVRRRDIERVVAEGFHGDARGAAAVGVP
jgi:hypothetical protein